MYNNFEESSFLRRFTMKRTLITAIALLFLAFISGSFLGSSPAPAAVVAPVVLLPKEAKQQPLPSVLFCSEKKSSAAKKNLEGILEVFEKNGDEQSLALAKALVTNGDCTYATADAKNGVHFWTQKGTAPKELSQFEAVPCKQLSNGYCIAVQPAFVYDNEGKRDSGYFLFEPRSSSQQKSHQLQETKLTKAFEGVIFDMNN